MRYRAVVDVRLVDEGAEQLRHMTGMANESGVEVACHATIDLEVDADDTDQALPEALRQARLLTEGQHRGPSL